MHLLFHSAQVQKSSKPLETMAIVQDKDHPISSPQHDDTDEKKSTISVPPEATDDEKPFPFFGLLCYADKVDWLLMALGTLGSAIHGMAFPIGYLLLGKALDAFGTNINDQEGMVHALYKVNIIMIHTIGPEFLLCWSAMSLHVSFSTCFLKVVPYVWYMAAATLPAGMVGKSKLRNPLIALMMNVIFLW
jgi:ATP-binding cassette subfamily B (MDR/TAP) protein 1